MIKRNQVRKSINKSAASPQSKTAHRRVKRPVEPALPLIALFPQGEHASLAEELVDLMQEEYARLKRAAASSGDGILMFMVCAALEKIGRRTVTCVFNGPDGREFARVDLPQAIFARIKDAASKRGMTLRQFVMTAVRNLIQSEANARRAA